MHMPTQIQFNWWSINHALAILPLLVGYSYYTIMPNIHVLYILLGEWVNEWNVPNASRIQYQLFGRAQLDVYNNASFGWSYWTLKNDRVHWDFEWNIKNKYLSLGMYLHLISPHCLQALSDLAVIN